MSDTHTKGGAGQMQRLREADAKTHMVVVIWAGSVGEEHYLYRDSQGWYVLGWPCHKRHYLTVDADGCFEEVTI